MLITWLFVFPVFSAAQAGVTKESLVKAAFIYNFSKLAEWSTNTSRMNICYAGNGKYGKALKEIEKRSNDRITYQVFSSKPKNSPCHIQIYAAKDSITKQAISSNLLTIGEGRDFVKNGGMIAFLHKGDKIKFVINLAPIEKAGIKLNSQLLEIAEEVIKP